MFSLRGKPTSLPIERCGSCGRLEMRGTCWEKITDDLRFSSADVDGSAPVQVWGETTFLCICEIGRVGHT